MKEDILDKYALQLLTDSDKIWLQKALKAEPGFQAELDLHLEIVKGIEMHTEKLFEVAFVELNALADQALKNSIQEIDKELEQEGFFEPILMPISTTQTTQPIVEKTKNSEVLALPNNSETVAKEPIKEVVLDNTISATPTSTKTAISTKTEQQHFDKLVSASSTYHNTTPNQLPLWVKMAIAAILLLLLIFLVVSNL